ncbi:unnamed protein product [Mytilus coruscus]|uniref:Uncharacterized protein n=1 Tax=Mytilus coruscus TaxID=42192 RepID=A0A6J8DGD3_MYTCO|nr:unnamed protein product [Mytilus coruscus]
MASAEFKELKSLIMGVGKKVSDFSQQLEKIEHNLTGMINEVKTDVNILKTKYDASQLEITSLRRDFTELEQGVAGMDLQIQAIEGEKLQKQKFELQTQMIEIKDQITLLEKHERKYNVMIYGVDDSNADENIYSVTRQLFSQNLKIEQRKANAIPIANAHRVPTRGSGPKPIIIRFLHYGDKQLIMSSAHNLKGSQIRILDDLPVSKKEKRFLLSHVAYKIRKKEKLQTRIRDVGAHMTLETRKKEGTLGAHENDERYITI